MSKIKDTEPNEAQRATADVLLDTAERLFASDGIENVSIRQIVKSSGHGNLSGAHYHFGTRETLIRTLLERRMAVTDALRHEGLDQLVQTGRDKDVRAIVEVAVRVLDRVVREFPWGRDYVLVAAQALFSPRIRLLTTLNVQAMTGLHRSLQMTCAALAELPPACVEERVRMFWRNGTYEVARWLQENELHAGTSEDFERMQQALCEYAAAGLAAPSHMQASKALDHVRPIRTGQRKGASPMKQVA